MTRRKEHRGGYGIEVIAEAVCTFSGAFESDNLTGFAESRYCLQ